MRYIGLVGLDGGQNGESWIDIGYQTAKGLLTLAPRPTAIFATSDIYAVGCIKAREYLKFIEIKTFISNVIHEGSIRLCS